MEYNAVLNRVRPMLTNGNHLSAQGFEALFGSCSQQEQEHLLAELAVIGILVDTSAAIPSSRKAASFCRSDFTSKQLWSMTNEQLCDWHSRVMRAPRRSSCARPPVLST